MTPTFINHLARNRDGVTVVEFAIVATPLIFLIFGSLDLAYQVYPTAVVQGTVNAAARKATLESASASTIETYVRGQLSSIASGTNLQINSANFLTYNKIGKPEKLVSDVNSNSIYDKSDGDCFIDDNRNLQYDAASQGASGIGTAEDVVRYQVTATYHRLSPIPQLMGMGDSVTISRTTFMRNEPYAGIVDPKKSAEYEKFGRATSLPMEPTTLSAFASATSEPERSCPDRICLDTSISHPAHLRGSGTCQPRNHTCAGERYHQHGGRWCSPRSG